MLTRHLANKILDIRLDEEKFYFPGETIKGNIVVHPKTSIKVNSVQLKFSGQVYIHLKEKETTTLFQEPLVISIDNKLTALDAQEHLFPFQFFVPKNLNLPSSMEFGKKGHIRYTINAILDRPMVPESLCPKVDYNVSLLEYIDIDKQEFKKYQEKMQDIMLPKAKYNEKCIVRASTPRIGFTRGDIVPLKVAIQHFTSYSRKDGVTVDLVRTVEIRTTRHTVFKESVLRSTPYSIDIKNNNQSINCQLLIPTSTPPSIQYKDKVLRFHYKIRVTVQLADNKSSVISIELPIVIGTWPRASVPIDDDDGGGGGDMVEFNEEEDPEEDIKSINSNSNDTNSRRSSNISWQQETIVNRSDSVNSHNSMSSYKSNRSTEYYNNTSLNRNTSTISSPDRLPSYGYYNTGSNRPSSIYSNDSLYPSNNNMNRNSTGSLQQLRNNRPYQPIALQYVPTHILEPLSNNNSFVPLTSPIHEEPNPVKELEALSLLSSSEEEEDDDLSDEDDLLAIIEKKKKKERRELKKQKRLQLSAQQ